MAKHVYFKCNPCKSDGHCMFCDGGVLLCIVCNCGESELAPECPGAPKGEQDVGGDGAG